MFSPGVFLCVYLSRCVSVYGCVCLCVCHDVCSEDLTMKDWCHIVVSV